MSSQQVEGVAKDMSMGVAIDVSMGVAIDVSMGVAIDVSMGVAIDTSMGVAIDLSMGVAIDMSMSMGVAIDMFMGVAIDLSMGVAIDVSMGVALRCSEIWRGGFGKLQFEFLLTTIEMASLWDDLESCVAEAPNSSAVATGDRGSIKPKANFNATEDALALKKAMTGLGTTEKTLIDILTHRTNAQRQMICKAYLEDTGRTLVQDLKGDTDGHFEKLLVALATPQTLYDCQEVRRAIEGVGTDDSILIEIFSSRSNQQIKVLCDAYLKETERKLTFDLKKETTKEYGTALLLLAEGRRDENTQVDAGKAKEDAKALYNAGEKKWGTDEAKFIEILCQRSLPQLRQTLVEFNSVSGKTLQQSIEGEMSGSLEDLLVAIVKCVKSVPAYFAERLHQSMKGVGTDEDTLIRIMVSRSEVDLLDIRAEFKKHYQHSLHSAIKSDVSGDLGACLLEICGGDD